jgi:acetyltransferase-like isoleucine patch superfamily enzyme
MLSIPPSERKLISKGPVIIGDNVWVGEGVAILPNVTIGRNCIIGTNSVVTKSIPENSVAAGIPAKVIKKIV